MLQLKAIVCMYNRAEGIILVVPFLTQNPQDHKNIQSQYWQKWQLYMDFFRKQHSETKCLNKFLVHKKLQLLNSNPVQICVCSRVKVAGEKIGPE